MAKINHLKRARRLWPLIVKAQRKRQRDSYSGIGGRAGYHHRGLRFALEIIAQYCNVNEWPPLQALVVRKDDLKPGSGYWGSTTKSPGYEKTLVKVFRHQYPIRAPF